MQLVELAGRNWLASELLSAGVEVAKPERDRGIDLIAYLDLDERAFVARPIQMKAATKRVFNLDAKYAKFPGLLLVYVWNVGRSADTECFALTYDEASRVAGEMGFTQTSSWRNGGGYTTTKPSARLRDLLKPYKMEAADWERKIRAG